MAIEKILLIGLAIAGVVAFTNFMNNGSTQLGDQAGDMSTALEDVQNIGLNFVW